MHGGSRSEFGTSDVVARPKCNNLSLKLKYEVIKMDEKEPKIDVCKLAGLFS